MEGKKRNDKWKNHNLPWGNHAKLNLFENTSRENNATVNFIMERSPSDLDRLLKSGPSFGVCFGTDRLLQPAEGRQVWGGTRWPLPELENRAHIWSGVQTRKSHGAFYWRTQVSVMEAVKSSPCFHNKRKEEQNKCHFTKAIHVFSNIYTGVQRDSKFPSLTLQLSSFGGHLWN